jgi:lipoprotein NlpI
MLGFLRYDRHEFQEAAAQLQKAIDLAPNDDYARFRLFLTRSRLGQGPEAQRALRAYLDNQEGSRIPDWPFKVGHFLLGDMTEREFLSGAQDTDPNTSARQLSEALYYVASQQLCQGDPKKEAARRLRECLAQGVAGLTEYASAKAELSRLKSASSQ